MEKDFHFGAMAGLTLVELVIVLVLLALLLSVGLPTFQRLQYAGQVQAGVHSLMGSIVFTRSEAIRRNIRVSMCPSRMAVSGVASCEGSYSNGWIVFENRDGDRVVDPEDHVVRVFAALPEGLSVTNRLGTRAASNTLSYKPDGSSGRTRTLLVCAPAGSGVEPRSVVMSNVGRPRLARDWGSCPG